MSLLRDDRALSCALGKVCQNTLCPLSAWSSGVLLLLWVPCPMEQEL